MWGSQEPTEVIGIKKPFSSRNESKRKLRKGIRFGGLLFGGVFSVVCLFICFVVVIYVFPLCHLQDHVFTVIHSMLLDFSAFSETFLGCWFMMLKIKLRCNKRKEQHKGQWISRREALTIEKCVPHSLESGISEIATVLG